MLKRATPGVVNISTVSREKIRLNPLLQDPFFRHFFDIPNQPRSRQRQSLGSGVIVDAESGYILTNNHVIESADEITVTLRDGRRFKAGLVGADQAADIAVIKIDGEQLTALPLADSDQLQVGDFVVAIGNPFGLGQTVTSGIVSALGRSGLGIEGYEDFIQTDASINPGNSGGALVNLRGELVGINTAIIAPGGGNVGIGFAIPINMAREVMQQLVEYGHVSRGSLGIAVQELNPALAEALGMDTSRGTIIAQVESDSPAERAGLAVGDVILEINGRPIHSATDVHNRVGMLRIGTSVDLVVQRDGQQRTLTAVIEALQSESLAGAKLHPSLAGARFGALTRTTPAGDNRAGILVTEVEVGSAAWQAGLREGDIIGAANRAPVRSLEEFKKVIAGKRQLLLSVRRGTGALFILIG
jgi:serine protease Do/serine protease DegQ